MIERLERRGLTLGRRRVAEILDAVAAAELPEGLWVERGDDAVSIRGRGLARRLAFDARLSAIGLVARQG